MAIRSRCYPLNLRRCLLRLLRGIRRNFFRLSPCCGQVPYVLLTRAPVAGGSIATPPLPLDLHVLSLSLAFILSQDQTLRCCLYLFFFLFLFLIRASEMSNTDRLFCSLFAFTETACGSLTLYRSKRRILEIDRDRFSRMRDLTLVLLRYVAIISMFSFCFLDRRGVRRKTLQRYNLYLNLANFSESFFNFLSDQ